jgi:predicted nucleotidyltransferase
MPPIPASSEELFGLPATVIESLKNVFAVNNKVEEVRIYGSRAKGTYRPGSDIDLTLLGNALQWNDLQATELAIDELDLPYKVDLSLYALIDNRDLREHIDQAGKVFYSR